MPDEKSDPQLSSSQPSSPSLPLDQSLVRAFGALETALTDLTASSQNNTAAVQKLVPQVSGLISLIKDRTKNDDKHRETVVSALIELTEKIELLAKQEGIAVGATVDARNALLAARDELKQSIDNITGEHPILPNDPDGAPRALQVIILHLTNFGWKNKAKLVGWISVAGISIYHAITQIAPYLQGVFR